MLVPFLSQSQEGSLAVCPVDMSPGSGHHLGYLCSQHSCAIAFLQVTCTIKDAVTIGGLLGCIPPSACLLPFPLPKAHSAVVGMWLWDCKNAL